jgi:hypothetical protein
MKISLITATYNSIQHIPNVLESLHSGDLLASSHTIENIVHAFSTPCSVGKEKVSFGKNDERASLPASGRIMGGITNLPDVVYGDLIFVDHHKTNKVIRYWKSRPFKPGLLNRGWMPAHPTVFMRREVYEKHGLYNINLKCASDYDYMLRVFRDQSLTFCYLPEVITKMRRGGVSTGGLKNLVNKRIEDYRVLKNNKMPFPLWILFAKNVSKIPQLIFRKR